MDAVTSASNGHPEYSLIVTGHGIEAAVATLAAAELRSLIYITNFYTVGSIRMCST